MWKLSVSLPGGIGKAFRFEVKAGWACRLALASLCVVACSGGEFDPVIEYSRGLHAFEQGQWARARVSFQRVLATRPDDVDTTKRLAISWLSGGGGSLNQGVEVLERYLELEPEDQAMRRYLVANLLRVGRSQDAARCASGLDHAPESLAMRARALADRDPDAAVQAAIRALQGDQDVAAAHDVLARLSEATGDFRTSFDHSMRVIELDPFDPKPYSRVIRLARYRGDEAVARSMAEALEIAGRLVQSREAGKLVLLAELRLVERLGKIVGSKSTAYRKRLAELLFASGRMDEGRALLDELREEDALGVGGLLAFGRRFADRGLFLEARELYGAAAALDPTSVTAVSSVALCDLALGEGEAARLRLEDIVASEQESATLLATLGRIEMQLERFEEAERHLGRALEIAPWEGEWRAMLVTLLRSRGNVRGADEMLAAAEQVQEMESGPERSPDESVPTLNTPQKAGGPPWFVDVAPAVGLDFVQYDGRSGERYYVETTGSGCGFLDFDDDGDLDVYLLTGAPTPGAAVPPAPPENRLYENRSGRFVDVTSQAGVGDDGYGMGMCVGDIDGDDRLDFMVANFGPDRLYRNLGNGRFEEIGERAGVDDPRWGSNCAFGDLDGDGDLDLYVSHYLEFDFNDNPKCGDDVRGIYGYCRPSSFRGVTDSLFINDGSGVFREEVGSRGLAEGVLEKGFGVIMTDIDFDRDLDIFVANDSTPNRLYVNDGGGVFEDRGLTCGVAVNAEGMTTSGMGVDVGDVDGDGLMDVALTNYAMEPISLYHHLGDLRFADVARERGVAELSLQDVGWGVVLADFDNDGDRDMAIANGHVVDNIREFEPSHSYEQTNVLLLNDGSGRFVDATADAGLHELPKRVSRALAVGDWNDDGRLDLLVANCNDRFELLENRIENDNHWLGLRLHGRPGNRAAIGARAVVTADGGVQIGEVRSGSSFQSQRDLRLHFGLGGFAGPVEIEMIWPDGSDQKTIITAVDRYVTIVQE
jgi:tetratricopeptide (TPR) repeat protein